MPNQPPPTVPAPPEPVPLSAAQPPVPGGVELTPVDRFGDWYAKREDRAGFTGTDAPSGAKVRQYNAMIANAPPGTPLVVGCSADSAMQIYVAHAARVLGRRGVVVVPARAKRSAATCWAADAGAEIIEVRPGYPSVYRAAARTVARKYGGAVRWDAAYAVRDTAKQTENIPAGVRRVIVPSGSGLTAAGVIWGLAVRGRADVSVVIVAVSELATAERVADLVEKYFSTWRGPHPDNVPGMIYERARGPYRKPCYAALPDGMILDPFYAAKASTYIRPGDCLWVSGRRPDAPV